MALVALLGGFVFASDGPAYVGAASIVLTVSGPSPSTLTVGAGRYLVFFNKDSVAHSVAFANGLCTVSVPPGYSLGPGGQEIGPGQRPVPRPDCSDNFPFYVGSYAYTVDNKFPGTVKTVPAFRSVTLTARTHELHRGERLTLHGEVEWDNGGTSMATKAPFPVIVLARYAGSQSFRAIATVAMGGLADTHDFWHLRVRPGVATSYVAEVDGQLPGGPVWRDAKSRVFAVEVG